MTHVNKMLFNIYNLSVSRPLIAGLTTNGRDANNPTTCCTTCLCVRSCSGVWHL